MWFGLAAPAKHTINPKISRSPPPNSRRIVMASSEMPLVIKGFDKSASQVLSSVVWWSSEDRPNWYSMKPTTSMIEPRRNTVLLMY